MEQNRALVILILLIIFFFPDGQGPDRSKEAINEIAHERYNLDVLRNSTFGHPGNLTGLLTDAPTPPGQVREKWRGIRAKLLKSFAEPLLAKRGAEVEEVLRPRKSGATVYRNATGSVLGRWKKQEFPDLPTTAQSNVTYPSNLTALDAGKLMLSIEDTTEAAKESGLVEVKMALRIRDEDGGSVVDVMLNGVHFSETGEMVAATTSERFAGIFALPHFMLHEKEYNQSKALLLPSIEKVVEKMEATRYMDAPWLTGIDGMPLSEEPQCEYIAYIQLHPVDPLFEHRPGMHTDTKIIMQEIEREMRFPTGSSLPPPPPLEATVMVYSPNCGVVLVADELEGQKVEPFYSQASHLGLGAAAVAALQIWILIRQMNDSNTLSTISRVSFWTITMMAVVDGYFFFTFMIVAIFLRACFLPMVAASFCYLMLSAVFGMRFLVSTYKVQRQSAPLAPAAPPPPPPATAPSDGLPLPATAVPQTPVIIPPTATATAVTDDEVNAEISALHTRFYFALIAILFFSLHAATWPPFYRDILVHLVLLIINSYWIPQIYRNIMRGCRKAFRWEFVLGTSICRLAGVGYIYLYPGNIFHSATNPMAVFIIASWVGLQIIALLVQDIFGPRFLIPSHSLPQVYDYHCPLPATDEEAAQEMGTPTDDGRMRSFDCVVCMQTVDVPVAGAADGRDGLLGRRGYMVTPCRHVFHSHCLEGWMRFRLQCPICRTPLPAL